MGASCSSSEKKEAELVRNALAICQGESQGLRFELRDCHVKSLSDEVFAEDELLSLTVSHTHVTALPDELENLSRLHTVDLSYNKLRMLPPSFGCLHALTSLDLTSNQLASLPPSFSNLKSLVHLQLSNNLFTQFPFELLTLTSLEELNLSSCKLVRFFNLELDGLARLAVLDLSGNLLERLPANMVQLVGLRTLDVSDNNLSDLPVSELSLLPNLEVIRGLRNPLGALPLEIQTSTDPSALMGYIIELRTYFNRVGNPLLLNRTPELRDPTAVLAAAIGRRFSAPDALGQQQPSKPARRDAASASDTPVLPSFAEGEEESLDRPLISAQTSGESAETTTPPSACVPTAKAQEDAAPRNHLPPPLPALAPLSVDRPTPPSHLRDDTEVSRGKPVEVSDESQLDDDDTPVRASGDDEEMDVQPPSPPPSPPATPAVPPGLPLPSVSALDADAAEDGATEEDEDEDEDEDAFTSIAASGRDGEGGARGLTVDTGGRFSGRFSVPAVEGQLLVAEKSGARQRREHMSAEEKEQRQRKEQDFVLGRHLSSRSSMGGLAPLESSVPSYPVSVPPRVVRDVASDHGGPERKALAASERPRRSSTTTPSSCGSPYASSRKLSGSARRPTNWRRDSPRRLDSPRSGSASGSRSRASPLLPSAVSYRTLSGKKAYRRPPARV